MKRAAISFSKLRNEIGLVGIEVFPKERMAVPRLAQQWKVQDTEKMAAETYQLYEQFQWGDTYIEQESGDHLIMLLKEHYRMPIKVITTGKKVKDAKKIRRIKVMDKIEMTEFLRRLKLNGQLRFVRHATPGLKELENQIPYFTKHTTEAGSVDYYAPGEEPDNLVKALMVACFSVRKLLQGASTEFVGGPITGMPPKRTLNGLRRDPEKEFLEAFPSAGGYF